MKVKGAPMSDMSDKRIAELEQRVMELERLVAELRMTLRHHTSVVARFTPIGKSR